MCHRHGRAPKADSKQCIANLIEAVCTPLSEESFDIGVPQHIILGGPLHGLDVAAHRQAAVVQHDPVSVRQLPEGFGWGYCSQPLRNGP